jgi:uncharacterized protein GlcG (DUF336 family)
MSEQVAEQVAQPEVAPSTLETPAEVAQGGSGNGFMEMIPEELREHPSLSSIKDVENLARSYVNAQRLIGSDKVPLPVNPTDEDLDNIYSRLGRPENASGYDISVDGNLITEEIATEYADMAHKLRLTPEQANGVLEYYRNSINQSDEQMQQVVQEQAEQTTAELQREWGRAFEQKVALAREVVDQFAGSEILQLRLDDGTLIGNHPAFIKAFAAIGDFKSTVTSEDTISDSAMNRQFTPAQAQAEVDAMLNDKSHAYWDRKNPVARERAVQRMQDLMAMIHE